MRQLTEDIYGIEGEEERRMVAMGVGYGLEGVDDVDWRTIAGR